MESLAVKYRPKSWKDLVCQDTVKKILQNQIKTGEFKQAYLFWGSAGTGKTTSARIFANEVNNGQGNVVEIDGASNNGVDNVRDLIDDCKMRPLQGKYKVYIIDEVHMLSQGAFNALLKVLEEPPKGVIFILATTDPHKIPATILSRCQRFDFTRIPVPFITQRINAILDTENLYYGGEIKYEEKALEYIAKLANGGMRDAIMKLDTVLGYTTDITAENVAKCLGGVTYIDMIDIAYNIIYKKPEDVMYIIDEIYMSGKDLRLFIRDMHKFIVDLTKYYLTRDLALTSIPGGYITELGELVEELELDDCIYLLEVFEDICVKILKAVDVKATIESEVLLACLK